MGALRSLHALDAGAAASWDSSVFSVRVAHPRMPSFTHTGCMKRSRLCAAEDLDDESLARVKQICGEAFESSPAAGKLYGELARRIRAELDKTMGSRGWSVVVGRSFGAYVTQKIKCYAYLSVFPGVNVLVWKA
jgi:hypothetical protein